MAAAAGQDVVGGMDDAALAAYVVEGFVTIGDIAAADAVDDAVDTAPAGEVDRGASPSQADEPAPDRSLPGPFSNGAAQAERATTARPAAALIPTFAAPEQEHDGGEGGSPTR